MTHRVVMTAGHVDHGKSTLLRGLTGMEPDRLDEEQRRGLTIDLGFVWTDLADAEATPPLTVAFVDVPGHERFVGTMLAGAGAAPAALLVVAADDGWSAQSSEHRDILDLLGVPPVAVAVTKADLAEDRRIDEVVAQVEHEIAGTSLDGAPIVISDGVSGRGLDTLRRVLHERLAALPVPVDLGRPRLWVDRSFAVAGAGTVVTGTLAEGRFEVGDAVRVLPAGHDARIRGLHALGRRVDAAGPGTRVAVNLVGVDVDEVGRGDAVVASGPWRVCDRLDAVVRALPGHEIDRTGAWHLHAGTADTTCRVLPVTDPVRGPERDGPDDPGAVRLVLDRALPLVAGDRFVLRESGRRATVGGGVVADPAPLARPRGGAERRARAQDLVAIVDAEREARVARLLAARGGVERAGSLLAAAGWPEDRPAPAGVQRVGDHLALDSAVLRWSEDVGALGAGTHDRTAVAEAAAGGRPSGGLAADLANHLVETGVLVRAEGGYALAEHADAAAASRAHRGAMVVAELAEDPFVPPDLDDLAERHGIDHREVNALVQRGDIVRMGRVAFARSAVREAIERLERLEAEVGPFTAAQAKEAWGTSRKYAIPLLEHLDAIGVTAFDGQLRTLTDRRPG